jgi:hypothetical protein
MFSGPKKLDICDKFLLVFKMNIVGASHMSDKRQMSIAMQRLVYFISMVTNSTMKDPTSRQRGRPQMTRQKL